MSTAVDEPLYYDPYKVEIWDALSVNHGASISMSEHFWRYPTPPRNER